MHSLRLRTLALFAALLVGAAIAPRSLHAQQGVAADVTDAAPKTPSVVVLPSVTTVAVVPTASAPPVAGPRNLQSALASPASSVPFIVGESPSNDAHVGAGSNLALMGVGAAGVVIGLLVGGDGGTIISLTSGVIGLVGLYRYLR